MISKHSLSLYEVCYQTKTEFKKQVFKNKRMAKKPKIKEPKIKIGEI